MIKKVLLAASAASMVLAPGAALAEGRNSQIDVFLQVPYACEVSAGNYELDLTSRAAGRNNVRAGVENALQFSQNGTTKWEVTPLRVVSKPVDSVLNTATGIRVNFANDASQAGYIGGGNSGRYEYQLERNVGRGEVPQLTLAGAFADQNLAIGGNIDEDLKVINPATGAQVEAPLLGGAEYRIRTTLRCTMQRIPGVAGNGGNNYVGAE